MPPSLWRHSGATHAPPVQYVEHGEPLFCQAPVELQFCGWKVPLHVVCVGAHEPWHMPPTHVWLLVVHEVPTVHVPVALHVSVWFDAVQPSVPATHVPVHAPLTHVCVLAVQEVPTTQLPD